MFGSNFWIILCLLLIAGCQEHSQRDLSNLDHAIDLVKSLQTTNTVSAPLNPYAIPVGVGLTGLIAMLESLRRVEKGKRKYAEHELNSNNKNNS